MPTGAKLMSAVFYGFLAYVGSHIVYGIFEAEAGYELRWGRFAEINLLIGVFVGWFVQGIRVGDTYNYAIQGGILSALSVVFWCTLLWSFLEMIGESMKLVYRGATEALVDVFRIAIDHSLTFATPTFIMTMFIGGMIGGYLAEWTSRRVR